MAITMPVPATRGTTQTAQAARMTHETAWRLGAAAVMGLATALFLIGTSWDIQWHTSVGRDRTLTPPHLLMLGGIAVAGLTSLALILLDTWRARRGQGVDAENSSRMFRVFQAPVGLALAGFGALLAVLAFPLDDYWHTLYGIDVTLWAPFHVMLGFSVVMIEVGALYVLAAEANRMPEGRRKLLTQGGFLGVLAVTLGTLLIFAQQGIASEGLARLGTYEFVLYPMLLAIGLPVGLVTAGLVTRRIGAATVLALVFVAIQQVMFQFVPWAMRVTVAAEGLSYRPSAPVQVLTPFSYPAAILVAALIVDAVALIARRRRLAGSGPLLVAGGLATVLVTLLHRPWATTLGTYYYPGLDIETMAWHSLPFTLGGAVLGVGLAVLLSRGLAAARH